jgi:hypothetical protein
MKTSCDYLKTLQPTWGPPWLPEMTAFEYYTRLQRCLLNLNRTNQMNYSQRAIACEILQQAKQHVRYNVIATQYLTPLQTTPINTPLGHEYSAEFLIGELEANQRPEHDMNLVINKFNQTKDNNKDNNRRTNSKFKYRREVQCSVCHGYGHDIDEDICRVGAQSYHSHQFWLNYSEKAKKNATAYSMANNRNQVKNTQLRDATDEEYTLHMEQIAHTMVNNFTPWQTHASASTASNPDDRNK